MPVVKKRRREEKEGEEEENEERQVEGENSKVAGDLKRIKENIDSKAAVEMDVTQKKKEDIILKAAVDVDVEEITPTPRPPPEIIEIEDFQNDENYTSSFPLPDPHYRVNPENGRITWPSSKHLTEDIDAFLHFVPPTLVSPELCSSVHVFNASPTSPTFKGDDGIKAYDVTRYSDLLERQMRLATDADRKRARGECSRKIIKRAKEGGDTSGKWFLLVQPDAIDAVWLDVARATAKGDLGCAAKVSPSKVEDGGKRKLICVYVADFSNKREVQRVLKALLSLVEKVKGVFCIGFKPDIYTCLNIKAGNPWQLLATMYKVKEALEWEFGGKKKKDNVRTMVAEVKSEPLPTVISMETKSQTTTTTLVTVSQKSEPPTMTKTITTEMTKETPPPCPTTSSVKLGVTAVKRDPGEAPVKPTRQSKAESLPPQPPGPHDTRDGTGLIVRTGVTRTKLVPDSGKLKDLMMRKNADKLEEITRRFTDDGINFFKPHHDGAEEGKDGVPIVIPYLISKGDMARAKKAPVTIKVDKKLQAVPPIDEGRDLAELLIEAKDDHAEIKNELKTMKEVSRLESYANRISTSNL